MPTWTKAPPDDPRGQGLPIIRTPATRPLRAIVTSDSLIGTDTHFWGGHTVPCERPDCDACNHRIPYRWHGYLAAWNPTQQLHFVFEMTAQAATRFQEYQAEHNTLRCCDFEAWRWRHAKNGRVILKLQHSAIPSHALPDAPDLCKIMSIIWRLPMPNVKVDGLDRRMPKVYVNSDGDGQSSDPRQYNLPQP